MGYRPERSSRAVSNALEATRLLAARKLTTAIHRRSGALRRARKFLGFWSCAPRHTRCFALLYRLS